MDEQKDYQEAVSMFEWLMDAYQRLCDKQCQGLMLTGEEIKQMEILFVTSFETAQYLSYASGAELCDRNVWQAMEDILGELATGGKLSKQKHILLLVLLKCYDYLQQFRNQLINQ